MTVFAYLFLAEFPPSVFAAQSLDILPKPLLENPRRPAGFSLNHQLNDIGLIEVYLSKSQVSGIRRQRRFCLDTDMGILK